MIKTVTWFDKCFQATITKAADLHSTFIHKGHVKFWENDTHETNKHVENDQNDGVNSITRATRSCLSTAAYSYNAGFSVSIDDATTDAVLKEDSMFVQKWNTALTQANFFLMSSRRLLSSFHSFTRLLFVELFQR